MKNNAPATPKGAKGILVSHVRYFGAVLLLVVIYGCATSPLGRRQLRLVGHRQMSQMGAQSFTAIKQKQKMSSNPQDNARVQCVTQKLLVAMGESPGDWEVQVFADSSPNAFALPGRKVGVHTGMLRLVANQDQLAAVIGHEIGHVLAHHGNERVSQAYVAQTGMGIADLALGRDSKTNQLILAGLGVGAQFGVLLPFSRKQETEADILGLQYMARAGFDPRQAPELWRLMKRAGGGGGPEFLSTHPSPNRRIRDLSARAPQHMGEFQAAPRAKCF